MVTLAVVLLVVLSQGAALASAGGGHASPDGRHAGTPQLTAQACQAVTAPVVITQPGCYTLSDSAFALTGTAVEIRASDVTLLGGGFQVDGTTRSFRDDWYGVYVNGTQGTRTNVTVENVVVTDWTAGVRLDGVDDSRLAGVTATDTQATTSSELTDTGLELANANRIEVVDSVFERADGRGISPGRDHTPEPV